MGLMMENVKAKEGYLDVDLEMGRALTDNNVTLPKCQVTSVTINNNNRVLSGGEAMVNYSVKQLYSEANNGGGVNLDEKVISSVALSCDDDKENVKLVVVERNVIQEEGQEKKVVKERPKAMSAKKPPKPPRPPRGLSLDSADQKLIRELHELAKLKRARFERMKAVKKAREAKVSSSKNQLFATLLTVLFCLVVLFQGISSRTSSAASFQGSPVSSGVVQNSIISVQHNPISSGKDVNGPGSESPRLVKQPSGVLAGEQASKAVADQLSTG